MHNFKVTDFSPNTSWGSIQVLRGTLVFQDKQLTVGDAQVKCNGCSTRWSALFACGGAEESGGCTLQETSPKVKAHSPQRRKVGCNSHLGGTAHFESDCIRNRRAFVCRKKCLTLLKNKRRKYHHSFLWRYFVSIRWNIVQVHEHTHRHTCINTYRHLRLKLLHILDWSQYHTTSCSTPARKMEQEGRRTRMKKIIGIPKNKLSLKMTSFWFFISLVFRMSSPHLTNFGEAWTFQDSLFLNKHKSVFFFTFLSTALYWQSRGLLHFLYLKNV